jgi:hypothetical protein
LVKFIRNGGAPKDGYRRDLLRHGRDEILRDPQDKNVLRHQKRSRTATCSVLLAACPALNGTW